MDSLHTKFNNSCDTNLNTCRASLQSARGKKGKTILLNHKINFLTCFTFKGKNGIIDSHESLYVQASTLKREERVGGLVVNFTTNEKRLRLCHHYSDNSSMKTRYLCVHRQFVVFSRHFFPLPLPSPLSWMLSSKTFHFMIHMLDMIFYR